MGDTVAASSHVQWEYRSTLIPAENKASYCRRNSTDSRVCLAISRCSKHQLVFQLVLCGFRFGSNQTNLICTLVFCSMGHKVWFDIVVMLVLRNHLSFTLVKNGGSGILSNFSNTFINIKIFMRFRPQEIKYALNLATVMKMNEKYGSRE